MKDWLLLIYKVPPTPTANRVYVWRKLKQLGALLLHDAVWVLPANERTREQFQWLATEISELQGEALLWQGKLTNSTQEQMLVQQFSAPVEAEYTALLTELSHPNSDLNVMSRRFQQASVRDYFHSDLGEQVRRALLSAQREEDEETAG